jgi:hypothetical protein
MRMFVTAALLLAARLTLPAQPPPIAASSAQRQSDPASVRSVWFRHIERNELDSLRGLFTNDFRFVSDGTRHGPDAFVAMIRGLGSGARACSSGTSKLTSVATSP